VQGTWPVGLLKINKIIDNPWSIGMVRAEKAGVVLADAIIRKAQGGRPTSLIGYSLGARAIYTCLMVLAERRQFGLVDSVVMIGSPAPSESHVWLAMKSVVSGRLVNVYSEYDYILGFLYRTSNIQNGIAGLQAIKGEIGVENYNVSNLVGGHLRYQYMIGSILKNIEWEDVNLDQVSVDEHTLTLMDEKYSQEEAGAAEAGSADVGKKAARMEQRARKNAARPGPRTGVGRKRRCEQRRGESKASKNIQS
jgi:hypothetical protein